MTLGDIMFLPNSVKVINEGALNSAEPAHNLHPALAFNGHFSYSLDIECQDQPDGDGDDHDDDDDEYNGEFDDHDDCEPYGDVNFEYEPGTYWDYGDDDEEE
ncbi:hypothetical protein BG006_001761 [Podila minutissima]|uniref:Uncharacterized protein n=1 Tax=Podila minutissima TaxID=64525 RepID=A0A9P5S9T6_9FUNG|nr:hypothetical protein BG006_001761 [Podila minutissima]